MLFGNVVNQLLDQYGFAHTGATKEAGLTTFFVGCEQINHLDARFKNFGLGRKLGESRGRPVNHHGFVAGNITGFIDRLTQDIKDPPKGRLTYGHGDRIACVKNFGTTHKTIGGRHGDGAHTVIAQQLLHFKRNFDRDAAFGDGINLKSIVNFGQFATRELGINDRANDLGDIADVGFFDSADHEWLLVKFG